MAHSSNFLDLIGEVPTRGQSPEAIQEDFPSLKGGQIYGAIAFYLDHQAEIDKYIEDTKKEFEGTAIPLDQRAKAEAAQRERRS